MPTVALALIALLTQPSHPDSARVLKLALPHALRAGETVWLEVTLGVVPRGTEIDLETTSGRTLGVVSPFAVRGGHPAGTYTIPVSADAISKGHVIVRMTLQQGGHAARAPSLKEVRKVRLKMGPEPK